MRNKISKQIDPHIRRVPNFPKQGVCFYDITTLFQDPAVFDSVMTTMADHIKTLDVTKVVGIEARGFIFGSALADRLRLGFVPARKPGKLPFKTISEAYTLEYGMGQLEIHCDSIQQGERVAVVDDLLATGGTARATCKLVEQLGGVVAGVAAVVALNFLPYEEALAGYNLEYIIGYDSETNPT